MKYVTQMVGLTVQNFVSAATGMAVAVALIRGFSRKTIGTLGQLLGGHDPVGALHPAAALDHPRGRTALTGGRADLPRYSADLAASRRPPTPTASAVTSQNIAVGPIASQMAIKHVGNNGGGFLNANSSHPFENPTPISNFVEMLSILLIPAGLTYTFGRMVRNTRQGWTVFAVMMIILVGLIAAAYAFEARGVPQEAAAGARPPSGRLGQTAQPGGNMEGKETRFGIGVSGQFAAVTTGTSTGSVNSMHDSYTPLGGMVPLGAHPTGRGGLRGRGGRASTGSLCSPSSRSSSPVSWWDGRPSIWARRSKCTR